jgi:hypothetical protein
VSSERRNKIALTLTHTPVDVSEVNQLVGVGALPQVAERNGCASDEVVAQGTLVETLREGDIYTHSLTQSLTQSHTHTHTHSHTLTYSP